MTDSETTGTRRRSMQAGLLIAVAAGMFGFAYALVPLYEAFCELTGINGRTASGAVSVERAEQAVASDREVTIQFLGRVAKGMPWEFRPTETRMRVRVGEMSTTDYYVRNRAAGSVTGQAVPSVSPSIGAPHLHKVECFCFSEQQLAGGAEVTMPVHFYVDPDLPEDVETLSLSYTFFRAASERPGTANVH